MRFCIRRIVRAWISRSRRRSRPAGISIANIALIWPADGSIHHLRTRGKVYRDPEGKDIRMTGACWDITERKSLEEDLARERFLLRMLMRSICRT